MNSLQGASYAAMLGMLISFTPTLAGIWFAIRPSERLLSYMRPLTLAGIFAAFGTVALGVTNGAIGLIRHPGLDWPLECGDTGLCSSCSRSARPPRETFRRNIPLSSSPAAASPDLNSCHRTKSELSGNWPEAACRHGSGCSCWLAPWPLPYFSSTTVAPVPPSDCEAG